jgi:hypothetical protein
MYTVIDHNRQCFDYVNIWTGFDAGSTDLYGSVDRVWNNKRNHLHMFWHDRNGINCYVDSNVRQHAIPR